MRTQLCSLALLVLPTLAAAADDLWTAEETVITAPRIETEIIDIPVSATLIDRQAIEQSRATSFVELLRGVTAANVLDETGNGNTQHLGFRAYEAWRGANTVVMLNGIPLRTFFNVPIELVSVERVEIVRGPSSIAYGGGLAAGLVNIVTRSGGGGKLALRPEISWGSNGLRKVGLFAGGGAAGTSYNFSGLYKSGDGFRDRNSAFEVLNFSARLVQQIDPRSLLSLNLSYWDGDKEFAGGIATMADLRRDRTAVFTDPAQQWPQQRLSGNVSYEGRPSPGHALALNFFFALRDEDQTLDSRAPGAPDPLLRKSQRDRSNLGLVGRYRRDGRFGGAEGALLVGASAEWDDFGIIRFDAVDGAIDGPPINDQNAGRLATALYALQEVRPTEPLELSAGLRYERIDNRFTDHLRGGSDSQALDALVPALGFRFAAGTRLDFYGNIARTFRPPQPQQLIDPTQGGNRDLDPAISRKYELGLKGRPGRAFDFGVAAYLERYEKDIIRVRTRTADGGRSERLQNVGETERRGVEAEARLRLGGPGQSALSFFANGALQRGEFSAHPNFAGNEIPYVPERLLSLGARCALTAGTALSLSWHRVGDQWGDNNNRPANKIPGYSLLNAVASYERGPLALFAKLNNLTDETYAVQYKTFYHGFLPGPPRHFEAGLQYRY